MIKVNTRAAAAVALLIAVISAVGWGYQHSAPVPPPAAATTIVVRTQPIGRSLALVGRIESAQSITLTAPFDGEVVRRRYEEGQYVEQDQVLVEFNSAETDVRLRDAQAERLRAQAALQKLTNWNSSAEVSRARRSVANTAQNLDDVNRRLEETNGLFAKGIVAKMEVDALHQQQRAVKTELAAAQEELEGLTGASHARQLRIAELEEANAQERYQALVSTLQSKSIKAPFAGIATKPVPGPTDSSAEFARSGMRVAKGQPMLVLASMEKVRVAATVDETEIRQLIQGQQVEITGDAFDGQVIQGKLEATSSVPSPISNGGAARYDIKVSIPELEPHLRSRIRLGMSASIKIITYFNKSAIVIPISAVHSKNGMQFARIARTNAPAPLDQPIQVTFTTEEGALVTGLKEGEVIYTH